MTGRHQAKAPPPLFILGCPRSFTSIVCAMLGQHPQMYAVPETHLFCEETLGDWITRASRAPWPMPDGLLRAVAELFFGRQDESAIQSARKWLNDRKNLTTNAVFQLLADRVSPLILIDKSPSTVNSLEILRRTRGSFPAARYIHLLRHPRGYCESIIRLIDEKKKLGPIPPKHWLVQIATGYTAQSQSQSNTNHIILDPQDDWYIRNSRICEFLESVPADHQMRVIGEEILAEPDEIFRKISRWMGLHTGVSAIEAMKCPERSPYSFLGPPGARYGNDGHFLQDPFLLVGNSREQRLEGPLGWREDGEGFSPRVKSLAQKLGYT
jgi:Sulfotransferase family